MKKTVVAIVMLTAGALFFFTLLWYNERIPYFMRLRTQVNRNVHCTMTFRFVLVVRLWYNRKNPIFEVKP